MKVQIGSPALSGVISSELLADHFMSADYPMKLKIINHMPRSFRHEALGIYLQNCAGGIDTEAEVTVKGFDSVQKLCTEVEAISSLNNYEVGIELHDLDALANSVGAGEEKTQGEVVDAVNQPTEPVTQSEEKASGNSTNADAETVKTSGKRLKNG